MASLASVPPELFVVFACALGAILGSFVNAAIHRLPRNISLWSRRRSFCPKCEAQLAWHENVPILSFLLLRGKCLHCRKSISARYLLVELLVAGLFALSAAQYFILNRPPGATPEALSRMPWIITAVQMFLAADLVCLSFADWEVWLIPWQTTMLWIPLGLILAPLFPELHISATPWTGVARLDALFDSLQGIIIGGGLLWLIGFACIVFLRKEGMGEGDVHLVAMVGSFLGWKAALATIMLGCFAGSVLGLATIAYDRIQQARLGDQYTPRKPTFEAPEEEGAPNESPDWLYLAQGLFVLALSGLLLWFWRRWGGGWEEGPTPISATLSAILGLNLVLAYFLKKKMLAAGTWPKPEVRTRKDGKKEEVYQGNYVAFGPALALAAIAVVFYDPAIRLAAEAYCLGHWPPDWLRLDWKVPGLG